MFVIVYVISFYIIHNKYVAFGHNRRPRESREPMYEHRRIGERAHIRYATKRPRRIRF